MDHHATTPLDGRVLEAMTPYLREDFGNAASRTHAFGWKAEAAVEHARGQVAALIGASPKEIVFTSGATESNNLALKGVMEAYRTKGDHLVTVVTEHKAVLDPCKRLERMRQEHLDELQRLRELMPDAPQGQALDEDPVLRAWQAAARRGGRVTYVPVAPDGRVNLDTLAAAMTESTVLVSVMLANNEVGTVQPIRDIGRLCRERGVLFHCDAAQGAGKVPFDVNLDNVDLASLSAHKLYGPKGVGALYVRQKPRVRVAPLLDGGGHERGLRSGTLNVPAIVGFGKAAEIARLEWAAEAERILALRERLRERLEAQLDLITVNGSLEHRLPGNLNVSFAYVDSDALLTKLRDIALSSGSACTSASVEPSYVLRALGVKPELARGALRFGLGRFTSEEEVDYVAQRVVETVRTLRQENPLYTLAQQGVDVRRMQGVTN
jgi:cysteine desulfurase